MEKGYTLSKRKHGKKVLTRKHTSIISQSKNNEPKSFENIKHCFFKRTINCAYSTLQNGRSSNKIITLLNRIDPEQSFLITKR